MKNKSLIIINLLFVFTFIGLEKVSRTNLWNVMEEIEINKTILKILKEFCIDNVPYVEIDNGLSELVKFKKVLKFVVFLQFYSIFTWKIPYLSCEEMLPWKLSAQR